MIEIILKFFAFGVKKMLMNAFYIFDSLIIFLNVIEIIYELSIGDDLFMPNSVTGPGVKALKFLRIFYFIVEINFWKTGAFLFKEMASTLAKTIDFIIVIFVFILFFTLFGRQIYAYTIRVENSKIITTNLSNGIKPRLNYDSFLDAFMTTTLIFLNEEWHVIMFQYMRGYGGKAAVFFVVTLLGGSVLLMKMFIALFINNFLSSKSIKKLIYKAPIWSTFSQKLMVKISSSPKVKIL